MKRRRDTTPDQLVARALALLAEAGVAPVQLLTINEAAALIPISPEAVRVWVRAGRLGFFDRRIGMFLIPLDELRHFVLEHRGSLSPALASDFVSVQKDSALSLSLPQRIFDAQRLEVSQSDAAKNIS